jgi:ABC-2 type transport system permease protein
VRSKAFVITLVAMPILMVGSIVVQLLIKDQVDTSDNRFVVVDRSGHFEDALTKAVREYNEKQIFEGAGDSRRKVKPGFVLDFVDPKQIGDPPESTWKLSERVRKKEIFGFLDIGADVVGGKAGITYHSINPVDSSFRGWASKELNKEIRQSRAKKENVPDATVERIVQSVEIEDQQLVTRNE